VVIYDVHMLEGLMVRLHLKNNFKRQVLY